MDSSIASLTDDDSAVQEISDELMDIQLPEISGLELARLIKADDDLKSIPIIAITAFAMKGDEDKILQSGCEGYIAKPILVANFLKTVAGFLAPADPT